MRVLFHIPSKNTLYAMRSILNGFKNAFINAGDEFRIFDQNKNFIDEINTFKPNLFITSSHFWYRKQINFKVLNEFRKKGMFVLVKIDFWEPVFSKLKFNEAKPLKYDHNLIKKISKDEFGDAYYHNVEQDDKRMEGFYKNVGKNFYTVPLACDNFQLDNFYIDEKYESDICFIGTNLNSKKKFFSKNRKFLEKNFNFKLIGQDWTFKDRLMGQIQKIGQFYNIKILKNLRKPKINLSEEALYYFNSKICLNVHEIYQRNFGGDCNERTFKIPFCFGFQLVDEVSCIKKYFKDDEVVFFKSDRDLYEKINYYLNNTTEKMKIIKKARLKVLNEHTYSHRVDFIKNQIMKLSNNFSI